MAKATGAGTYVCPSCGNVIEFTVDIETDADGNLYSSRAKEIEPATNHKLACKVLTRLG